MSSEFAEPRGKPFLTFPPSPTYFPALIHVGHLFLDFLGQIQPEKYILRDTHLAVSAGDPFSTR